MSRIPSLAQSCADPAYVAWLATRSVGCPCCVNATEARVHEFVQKLLESSDHKEGLKGLVASRDKADVRVPWCKNRQVSALRHLRPAQGGDGCSHRLAPYGAIDAPTAGHKRRRSVELASSLSDLSDD